MVIRTRDTAETTTEPIHFSANPKHSRTHLVRLTDEQIDLIGAFCALTVHGHGVYQQAMAGFQDILESITGDPDYVLYACDVVQPTFSHQSVDGNQLYNVLSADNIAINV